MIQLQINGNNSYLEPQPGVDTSDAWFPALVANIAFMNSHKHDGVSGVFTPVITQAILSANWVAAPSGGGLYRQLITMPTGMAVADYQMQFRLSNGNIVNLSVEPQSSSTYYVYINDSSQAVTAVYSS